LIAHILKLTALEGSISEGHEAFQTVCHNSNRHWSGRLFVFIKGYSSYQGTGQESSGYYPRSHSKSEARSMERLRIILISEDHFVSLSLSAMLQNMGHTVITCAHDIPAAINKARDLSPDLVIMDERCGLQAAKAMLEQFALPIVLITRFVEPELVGQADAIGVAGYMITPVFQKDLQPALVFARSRFMQFQSLKQEIVDLKNMIRSRKLIEQAKGLLMERECIPEAEAFRRIQCMSRNQNIPMAALSEAIIMTDKLTNKTRVNKSRSREYRGTVQNQFQD